jgi:hypothetical protein
MVRPDLLGVTSFVRASFLWGGYYHLLLNFFHSRALVLPLLTETWIKLALRLFVPVTEGKYRVFVADGLKVPKEGKRMPAVKCLHQESTDNSKPAFIMGHSFQVISLLVTSCTGQVFAVPLYSRICEGVRWTRKILGQSLLDTFASMFLTVAGHAGVPSILVADAYYACRKVIDPLFDLGYQLISRSRCNTVAYELPKSPIHPKRGRPKKYGRKVKLRDYFKAWQTFSEAPSPVYGETNVLILYRAVDLLWRPIGRRVRFVLVKHPTRGKIILISSALDLDPLSIIRIYGVRFKIEVSFKQALHSLGTYAYHFWMKAMDKIKWGDKDQNLERAPLKYRQAVARKIDAYHRYVQIGCIVQGLLQHLAINFRLSVWRTFNSWLRTMKPNRVPSEMVVALSLRHSFPQFLLDTHSEPELKKFILDHADPDRIPGINMVS